MNLSNYCIKQAPAPIEGIIKQLFQDRVHRRLKIDKSDIIFVPSNEVQLRRQYSQLSQRSNYSDEIEEDKVLLDCVPALPATLKRKIIKRQLGNHRFVKQQKLIHEKHNLYLLNFLHKTNLLLIKDRIPPNLSVHQTVDQGNFLENDDGTLYERKIYPHYSNVIQLNELPIQSKNNVLLSQPQKIRPHELYFQLQDNCVIKVKQVYEFVGLIFKKSVHYMKKARSFKNIPEYSNMEEHQNHEFDLIALEMGIQFRTAKYLYDILNDFYDLETEMNRWKRDDSKMRALKQIKESLKEILDGHKVGQTVHIPKEELYISLGEVRKYLHQHLVKQQEQSK